MSDAGERPDGRRSRWDEHKLERRALILDSAISVIEESPPDAEIHVQQIAERAGLGRPVLYRHFTDRADLDQAVQTRILDSLRARLSPQVVLAGTVDEIIVRIVSTYVEWAAEHPNLHRVAAQDFATTGRSSPFQSAVESVAGELFGLVSLGVDVLGIEVEDDDRAGLELLVAGIVGMAVSAVRGWLARPQQVPDATRFARLISDTVWYLIDGHTRVRGVTIDPDLPLEDLVEAAWTAPRT
ncbi:TetR/AcrR family transcriptional regulator [Nocardioides jensenii]|uniref:TetR/AcrR family transcriptional regulator n=1 Tax=Nocardioides jensenii TaxID=1843 RepID=UPI0008333362|nr:TetR/AcrR family transcriptional regulator [Nocardioides jensenii]